LYDVLGPSCVSAEESSRIPEQNPTMFVIELAYEPLVRRRWVVHTYATYADRRPFIRWMAIG
jgi:hypothetical protein